MFLPSNMTLFACENYLSWEKTNILVETRITFLVGIVRESLILVCFLGENYIKPRRELSFSLLENDNSRLNIVILPLIRGENHVIRGTITVSNVL